MSRKRERICLAFDIGAKIVSIGAVAEGRADNFYVASERLRNPALVGKPVAIQQKTITATCSYEARERGVRKLCLIGDAKRMCPDLIIVNGEDLTYYRRDSRRIWRLVSALVGQHPEKLGMDELFLDVTSLVDAHLADTKARSARYFRLSRPGELGERGFHYETGIAGVALPSGDFEVAPENQRYVVASHVAAYIRTQIAHEIGFTTSAGIAPNKLLAKLIASENKPANQTCWLPPLDPMERTRAIEEYMANLPVKNLNGFGHRIIQNLRHHLFGEAIEEDTYWTEPLQPVAEDEKAWEPENVRIEENPLLCGQVREAASRGKMETWFGERLGSRLWGLLWGIDDESVIPAPEFPKQISVEDSYLRAKLPTVAAALQKISALALSLLTRLEAELVDEPASLVSNSDGKARTWARHPTQIRLTLRGGPGAGSKTVPMPFDTLDLAGPPLAVRAEKLAQTFHSLFRKMIGVTSAAKDGDKVSLHVINLAVVSFESHAPTPSVRSMLSGTSKKGPPLAHAWINDSDEDSGRDEEDAVQCSICDEWLPNFVLPAHLNFHIEAER